MNKEEQNRIRIINEYKRDKYLLSIKREKVNKVLYAIGLILLTIILIYGIFCEIPPIELNNECEDAICTTNNLGMLCSWCLTMKIITIAWVILTALILLHAIKEEEE